MEYLNIALPKGRLGEKVYEMFEKIGYGCPAIKEKNRQLQITKKAFTFFILKQMIYKITKKVHP